ncbi:MAG: excinuclease ABC subunit UvrA, partial [Bacteroidota bacterium]
PATYTGFFDLIRDLFANLEESAHLGYDKSHFSFNTRGGRCESCEGAGYQQVGMHFMGNVEVLCEECEGARFNGDTLKVAYNGKSISEVLSMDVSEAKHFFSDQPRLMRFLNILDELGLGYLQLGQRSSTLSGGEAQRVKLATELARPTSGQTLYILDEPTTGLHQNDVGKLYNALNKLANQGNTIIVIEHHPGFICSADHVIDLGPESGEEGGYLVVQGTPEEVAACPASWTGMALKKELERIRLLAAGCWLPSKKPEPIIANSQKSEARSQKPEARSRLTNVTTHNLKGIDVTIPHNKITVITGVSGSGKSSLAFDTIHAEGMTRYLDNFSAYTRTRIGIPEKADFDESTGLTATLAIDQRSSGKNPRSTVGTTTGVYELYRLLFSRIGTSTTGPTPVLSSLFSFNHLHGSCQHCKGLGTITLCDPHKLITFPDRSILSGALDGTKTGRFYGDPYGQFVATLKAVEKSNGFDFSVPWNQLKNEEKEIILFGSGEDIYDVTWYFMRDKRTGEHHFNGPWIGFARLVKE